MPTAPEASEIERLRGRIKKLEAVLKNIKKMKNEKRMNRGEHGIAPPGMVAKHSYGDRDFVPDSDAEEEKLIDEGLKD